MGNKQSIRDLLKSRDVEYGQSWLKTGILLKAEILNINKVRAEGFFFNWVMILNKLVRILSSPRKIDHWKDIAGYAILVVDHLERANEAGHRPVSINTEKAVFDEPT